MGCAPLGNGRCRWRASKGLMFYLALVDEATYALVQAIASARSSPCRRTLAGMVAHNRGIGRGLRKNDSVVEDQRRGRVRVCLQLGDTSTPCPHGAHQLWASAGRPTPSRLPRPHDALALATVQLTNRSPAWMAWSSKFTDSMASNVNKASACERVTRVRRGMHDLLPLAQAPMMRAGAMQAEMESRL